MNILIASNTLAVYEKRECPGNEFYCYGDVYKLPTGRLWFVPNNKELSEVEVEKA